MSSRYFNYTDFAWLKNFYGLPIKDAGENLLSVSYISRPRTLDEHLTVLKEERKLDAVSRLVLIHDMRQIESGLWAPSVPLNDYYTIQWPTSTPIFSDPKPKVDPPAEPEFEVDLTEALVGWKSLNFNNGFLNSIYTGRRLQPLKAATAACRCTSLTKPHQHPPAVNGTCGFYAADDIEDTNWDYQEPLTVLCEVYGWGRYVRGDAGWRSQQMYLKAIHLTECQSSMVEDLKKYQVPIHIKSEIQIYDPEEAGYEHGQEGAAWDLGAGEGAGPAEGDEEGAGEEA
jgi:hypothetical protein